MQVPAQYAIYPVIDAAKNGKVFSVSLCLRGGIS
jgi:hypothetical protein